MKKGEMGSETACVWINTSIMIVRSSKSRSEAVSLPTVDTITCHGFGHEDHQSRISTFREAETSRIVRFVRCISGKGL